MADFPTSQDRLVTVFGGSGFVGRHIVRAFAREGWRVRAAMRRPDLAGFLQPMGAVGQVQPVQANLRYPASVAAAVEGADIVVNAAGIKVQQGRQSYEAVHAFGSSEIGRAAKAAGANALVHISGLGADSLSTNAYIGSKGRAEDAIRAAFPDATIVRPSVVFGPEDEFFNRFAALARLMPLLPMFGGGETKLQPVFVGDIALAVARVIHDPSMAGKIFELGGPDVMRLKTAMELVLKVSERKRFLLPLPFGLSSAMAGATEWASTLTLGKFPKALTTTRDQIDLLREDNIVSEKAIAERRTLQGLGVDPKSVEAILPTYITRFRKTGQFAPNRFA